MSSHPTWLNSEHVFLACVVGFAGWLLVGSTSYSEAGAMFPRLSAGITLVLVAGLLLFRVLPEDLQAKLSSTASSVEYGGNQSEGSYSNRLVIIVLALFVLYLAGVYVLGFFIATPIYVYGTLVAFEYANQLKRLAITVLATVLVAAGYLVLGIPFTSGAIFDYLPI